MDSKGDFSVAYLILAHANYSHLERLCRSLLVDERSIVFVHMDKKSVDFNCEALPAAVRFLKKRHRVYWGDFSTIEATYSLMQTAYNDAVKANYFMLLSGVDFPIRHICNVNDYLMLNRDRIFMDADVLPSDCFKKPLELITWNYDRAKYPCKLRKIRRTLKRIGLIKHHRSYTTHLKELVPYSGSQWWGMSRDALEYLLEWRATNKRAYNYCKNVINPEETMFQIALMNSHLKKNVSSYITYCDWSDGPPHPLEINEGHLNSLLTDPLISNNNNKQPQSVYQFARKFNDDSLSVIEKLPSYVP